MIKYVGKILEAFPEEIKIKSIPMSPALDHLFEVRDDDKQKLLPEELVHSFHHSVAQVLLLCMRV